MKKTTTGVATKVLASKPTKVSTTKSETKVTKLSKPKAVKQPSVLTIDKACESALKKLKQLNIDESFQAEIQWCLGSYSNDGNASGLYLMAKRAQVIFTNELANKTKGVTIKLVSDLEQAIADN